MLPTLKDARETTLSKHIIVDESVKHHHAQQEVIDDLSRSLEDLKRRHEQLQADFDSWRQAARLEPYGEGLASLGGLAARYQDHAAPSLAPQDQFPASAEQFMAPMQPQRMASAQQHAASQPSSVLSGTSAYPGSLVSLAPHPSIAGSGSALEALDDQLPRPDTSEMLHSFGSPQDLSAIQGGNVASADESMQYLLAYFQQNPGLVAGIPQMTQMIPSTMQSTNASDMQQWALSEGLPDLSRTGRSSHGTGAWGQSAYTADAMEMNMHNAHFRNDNTIMNV